jgi:hypothetical protein
MPEMSVSHEVSEENSIISSHTSTDNSVALSAASSKVSPIINLKFRARSTKVRLEDSKAVLSVNITPPNKEVRVVTVQSVGISTAGINSVTETQKSAEDRDNGQNVNVSCNNGGNTNCKTVEEVPKGNGTNTFCSVKDGDSGTADHKLQNIQTKQLYEAQNTHEFSIKTDLNLRNKCPSVVGDYSHESDDASKEWDFDSSSSSNSDQNSDDSVASKGEAK